MPLRRILPWVFLVILALAYAGHADDAAGRAQDIAQMKRVWEALMAYKKDNGKLPDQLGEIVPKYLANPKDLLSPRHSGKDANGLDPEDKHPSSYVYEWGQRKRGNFTRTEVMTYVLEEWGPVVPLLRCTAYERELNLSHAGDVYQTESDWEYSTAVQEIIARRGLGPGASKGRFLEVITADSAGAPVSGVKVTVKDRYMASTMLPTRTVTTGHDGRVRVPFGLADMKVALLDFEKPGHFAFSKQAPRTGFPETLRVLVTRTRTISGIATNSKGEPLADVAVHFTRELNAEDPQEFWSYGLLAHLLNTQRIGVAVTGRDGRWRIDTFPDQPALKVKCAASHPNFAVKVVTLDFPTLERGGYFSGQAKLAMAEPFRVRGKVIARDGRPAAEVLVFWYSSIDPAAKDWPAPPFETKSNADGEFEFRTRIPGPARIVVLPKSDAAPMFQAVTASPEMAPPTLQLGAGRVLRGKALNPQMRPVSGVQIVFTGWEAGLNLPVQPFVAVSDNQGNWTWDHAPLEKVSGRAILPSGTLTNWWEPQGRAPVVEVPLGEEQ